MTLDMKDPPEDYQDYTVYLDGDDVTFACIYASDEKHCVEVLGNTRHTQAWCDKHWKYQINLEPTSLCTIKVWGNVVIRAA